MQIYKVIQPILVKLVLKLQRVLSSRAPQQQNRSFIRFVPSSLFASSILLNIPDACRISKPCTNSFCSAVTLSSLSSSCRLSNTPPLITFIILASSEYQTDISPDDSDFCSTSKNSILLLLRPVLIVELRKSKPSYPGWNMHTAIICHSVVLCNTVVKQVLLLCYSNCDYTSRILTITLHLLVL